MVNSGKEIINKEIGTTDENQLSTIHEYANYFHINHEFKNRLHSGMVILRVNDGSLIIRSSQPEVHIKKDEFCFIGAHQAYDVIINQGFINIQTIVIHMGFVLSSIQPTTHFHRILRITDLPYLYHYFDEVFRHQQSKELANILKYRGSLLLLLGEIASCIHASDALKDHKIELKTYQMTRYIEKNFDKKITLDILSKEFGYSPQYISAIFKNELNTTFHHYLTYKRLKKSLYLLNTSESKIINIAYACGFANERAFVKAFKERYGISPSQYKLESMKK